MSWPSAIAASVVALAGCDSGYRIVVEFEPASLAERVERVEVSLVESCAAQPSDGSPAVGALSTIGITRDATSGEIGSVSAGEYGLFARGFDGACSVVAFGCADVALEQGGDGDLRVSVATVAGPGCAPDDRCVAGACVPPGVDAGTIDGGARDGGGDGGPPDAGSIDARHVDAPCTSADDRCVGDVATICTEGALVPVACALGCSSTSPRCARVAPSNVSGALFDASAADVTVTGDEAWDTSACDRAGMSIATQGGGAEACVLATGAFTVAGTLTVQGDRPLIVLAEGAVRIGGTIDVSARGVTPGPGGGAGGTTMVRDGAGLAGGEAGTSDGLQNDYGGGGGGGACGAGGSGGASDESVGGAGGSAVGATRMLEPLVGGSGGGLGPGDTSGGGSQSVGGAGGGAIQITSQTSIDVTGLVLAGGGGGDGSPGFFTVSYIAGGGAGSGGSVLLEAPEIALAGGAVRAPGGGGGASGGGGTPDGEDGADAADRGGAGATSSFGADGGDGGGGATVAGRAGARAGTSSDGGGGGGGAGCIVLRTADGALPSGSFNPSVAPGVRAAPLRTE